MRPRSPRWRPRSCGRWPTPVRRSTETLDAYLDSGGAIEACARKLFVHPNTVRYRLKRIADFTGRDPTLPRDAYVLRVAATVGRLGRQTHLRSTPNAACSAGDGRSLRRPGRRIARANRSRSGIDGVASHAVLWRSPQKHKTRFIISYTAQNRLHSVLLNTCLASCLRPDRAPRLPACSPHGSSCPALPSVSLPGRRSAAWTWPAWAPPRPPRRSPTPP